MTDVTALPRAAMTQPLSDRRIGWIDSARGIGIILVVFGHVWRGLASAGLIADAALFRAIDDAIYLFHMPLFFFLSGMVFPRAIAGRPIAGLVRDRIARLLYPLVIWTYLFTLFRAAAGSLANNPSGLADLVRAPLPPLEYLWFLWALFLCQCIAIAIFRGPFGVRSQVTLAVGVALAAWPVLLDLPGFHAYLNGALANLPIFILGVLAGRVSWPGVGRAIGLGAAAIFLLGQALIPDPASSRIVLLLAGNVVALAFLIAWIGASRLDVMRPAGEVLGRLGRVSMAIYLAHVVFASGLRIALVKAGVDDLLLHVALGTIAGIAGPLGLLRIAQRFGVARVLGF